MSNLTATTRELWDSTIIDQVYKRLILPMLLIDRRQIKLSSGTAYKHTVQYGDSSSDGQEYGDNETLTETENTLWKTVQWYPKRYQRGISVPYSQIARNEGGGDGQVIPLEEALVREGHTAVKRWFATALYRTGSATRDADGPSGTAAQWQGINDALTHDIQYGGIARLIATPTNTFWQGASIGANYTDQATARSPSVNTLRQCVVRVQRYVENDGDLIAITSNTNFIKLQAEIEAQQLYKPGKHASFGFKSMDVDGVEVFAEPHLEDDSTRKKYFYLLNLSTWRLGLDSKRKFGFFTGFVDQSTFKNGTDSYLGRFMLRGNLMCLQPNANIFLSNVS